jgi:hypothetical protein
MAARVGDPVEPEQPHAMDRGDLGPAGAWFRSAWPLTA